VRDGMEGDDMTTLAGVVAVVLVHGMRRRSCCNGGTSSSPAKAAVVVAEADVCWCFFSGSLFCYGMCKWWWQREWNKWCWFEYRSALQVQA